MHISLSHYSYFTDLTSIGKDAIETKKTWKSLFTSCRTARVRWSA